MGYIHVEARALTKCTDGVEPIRVLHAMQLDALPVPVGDEPRLAPFTKDLDTVFEDAIMSIVNRYGKPFAPRPSHKLKVNSVQ